METARADTPTTHEDWSALREHLQQDHRKPESRAILIKAWKNSAPTSFEQPAAAAAGSSSIVGAEQSIFDLADDDDVEVPAPPPPVDTEQMELIRPAPGLLRPASAPSRSGPFFSLNKKR